MAEQATVFGRVILGERGGAVLHVAGYAAFFRFFLPGNGKKFLVIVIPGQRRGGLLRSVEQKEEDGHHAAGKGEVRQQSILFVFFLHHSTQHPPISVGHLQFTEIDHSGPQPKGDRFSDQS